MTLEFFFLILGVGLAGGVGAVLRLYLAKWQGKLPWGILAGNVLASLLVGLLGASQNWFLAIILITGLAGGLSTFSSFAAQTVEFVRRGRIAQGLFNVLVNLALSSTALYLGQGIALALLK
jgi:CrcB protein